jgi:predicted hydrocarbon binding protein
VRNVGPMLPRHQRDLITMPTTVTLDDNIIGVGQQVLHSLRQSLTRDLGENAAVYLQEAGFAAGKQVYDSFLSWLPNFAGVDDPADLDVSTLSEVLSAFFEALGWGSLTIDEAGKDVLRITASDWAEAEPNGGTDQPSCYVSSGLLADFLGRLSSRPVAVMEVECRTRSDDLCRFIAGAPQTMEAVFDVLAAGGSYESALSD